MSRQADIQTVSIQSRPKNKNREAERNPLWLAAAGVLVLVQAEKSLVVDRGRGQVKSQFRRVAAVPLQLKGQVAG